MAVMTEEEGRSKQGWITSSSGQLSHHKMESAKQDHSFPEGHRDPQASQGVNFGLQRVTASLKDIRVLPLKNANIQLILSPPSKYSPGGIDIGCLQENGECGKCGKLWGN